AAAAAGGEARARGEDRRAGAEPGRAEEREVITRAGRRRAFAIRCSGRWTGGRRSSRPPTHAAPPGEGGGRPRVSRDLPRSIPRPPRPDSPRPPGRTPPVVRRLDPLQATPRGSAGLPILRRPASRQALFLPR